MASWHWLTDGGVTSPTGFQAAGGTGGLKESGASDVALVVSERDCAAAGVFTRNRVVAACVTLNREVLATAPARVRAVVTNAGNANACTGEPGLHAAHEMQALTARALGVAPEQVLELSTGVIGQPLDLAAVQRGVQDAATTLSPAGGADAARAIMTTDTRPKQAALAVDLSGGTVTLGAMAKGSGMIHPDMATMLAVITCDAVVEPTPLQQRLGAAVDRSFNRISVDGDTSTNDTVLLLANGAAGVALAGDADRRCFAEALEALCVRLAQLIVRDGEGASRFVTLEVTGARTEADAVRVGRTIATSPLVKTALAGGDPNWGRILAAAGRAGVAFDPTALTLTVVAGDPGDLCLIRGGAPTDYREADAAALFAAPELTLRLDLGQGDADATIWTTDLTHDYVTINADYRT